MNIESLAYSIVTAIIGMAVVFMVLGVLSILMHLLRTLFDQDSRRTRTQNGAPPAASLQRNGGNKEGTEPPKEVILAAASLYLDYEERSRASSAAAWATEGGGARP